MRQRLPEVEVWGEDFSACAGSLLSDPRLQSAQFTAGAAGRTELTKAQLGPPGGDARKASARGIFSPRLHSRPASSRLAAGEGRACRNCSSAPPSSTPPARNFPSPNWRRCRAGRRRVFPRPCQGPLRRPWPGGRGRDRDGAILGLAMSCRVLGAWAWTQISAAHSRGKRAKHHGRIIPTARNIPVRNLFRDNGFCSGGRAVARIALGADVKAARRFAPASPAW